LTPVLPSFSWLNASMHSCVGAILQGEILC
jgi:hypothetical protein